MKKGLGRAVQFAEGERVMLCHWSNFQFFPSTKVTQTANHCQIEQSIVSENVYIYRYDFASSGAADDSSEAAAYVTSAATAPPSPAAVAPTEDPTLHRFRKWNELLRRLRQDP